MSKEQGSESAVSRSQSIKEEEMAEEKEAPKKVSRREFVKGAAVGGAGVAAAGALASCAPAATPAATTAPAATAAPAPTSAPAPAPGLPEEETDVLVVGMGFSGLCAANRAADSGVRVTLIEKIPQGFFAPGGCVVMSGLSCGTVGLSLAAPEDEIAEMLAKTTANRAPTDMIRAYAGNANRAIEWIQGCGVEFVEREGGPTGLAPGIDPPILNNKQWGLRKPGGEYDSTKLGGKVNAERLLSRLEDMGATILFETPARKLLTNDKGEVVGAEVKTKDGLLNIKAKAVILCTGGILQNQEMVSRYFGAHAAEMIPYVPPGVTGDGFEMARKVGAAFRMPTLGGGVRPIPEEALWNEDHLFNNLNNIAYYGIFVDEYGNRSFDESFMAEQKNAKHHMMKHTESVTGMVLVGDAAYQREENVKGTFDRVLQFGGTVYEADTIEELAEKAQTDALGVLRPSRQQDLVTTVKAFDKAIEEGKNMELRPSRKDNLEKIETPPIRAVTFTLMSETFMGGLRVNEKAEVVCKDGGVVPGLYGAGEMMHNSIGGGPMNTIRGGLSYVGCNALCIVFGMLSGENAGERAKA